MSGSIPFCSGFRCWGPSIRKSTERAVEPVTYVKKNDKKLDKPIQNMKKYVND